MNLIIDDIKSKNFDSFVEWLIEQIQQHFIGSINPQRLIVFDNYFKNFDWGFIDKKTHFISTKQLLISAIYNLRYRKTMNSYTIEINPNAVIPSTSAKFIDIAKLVNYGNVELPAYPIFTDTFDYIADNFGFFFDEYSRTGD